MRGMRPAPNPDSHKMTTDYDYGKQIYPNSYTEPSTDQGITAPFVSSASVPYRGSEGHGLPVTEEPISDAIVTWDNTNAVIPDKPHADTHIDAVDVRIVENNASSPNVRRDFRTRVFPLTTAKDLGQSQNVIGRMDGRTNVSVGLKSLDGSANIGRVWVGPDSKVGPNNGAPLDAGDSFSTTSTEDVWFTLDPAAAYGTLLVIMIEYDTVIKAV